MAGKLLDSFYETGIAVQDDFISPSEVAMLLEEIKKRQDAFKKAGIGNKENYQVRSEIRGDLIAWLDREKETLFRKIYFDKLDPVIEAFNRNFYLGISQSEHHLAFYPAGTHYEKHVDTFKNTDARVVSTVLYLNSGWQQKDGGELCVYPKTGPSQKIEPLAGRLALFESTLEHEVLTCHAPRYSITGWFKRGPAL